MYFRDQFVSDGLGVNYFESEKSVHNGMMQYNKDRLLLETTRISETHQVSACLCDAKIEMGNKKTINAGIIIAAQHDWSLFCFPWSLLILRLKGHHVISPSYHPAHPDSYQVPVWIHHISSSICQCWRGLYHMQDDSLLRSAEMAKGGRPGSEVGNCWAELQSRQFLPAFSRWFIDMYVHIFTDLYIVMLFSWNLLDGQT